MERVTDMNMIQSGSGGQQYLDAIRESWPLFAFTGGAAFLFGLKRIKGGFKQRTLVQIVSHVTLQGITQGFIGGGAALLAPMFCEAVTPAIQLGIGLFFGIYGTGAVMAFARSKFGLTTFDPMDEADMNAIRDAMPEDMRRQHARQCPFHAHGDDAPADEACQGCGDCEK
ncbi:MAG: hypothetical protein E7022_03085 [Desulfovibrio desulfuricans]|nr:hypothetical protein [Desulfovibrio desulfuricans]